MGLNFLQFLELDACTRCGLCLTACDSYSVKKDESAVISGMIKGKKRLMKSLTPLFGRLFYRGGADDEGRMENFARGLYSCTLCGRCEAVCPVKIKTRDLAIAMREDLVESGREPMSLRAVREAISKNHNIFNYPNEERSVWLDYMDDIPAGFHEKRTAETLYYVGCLSSFSPAVQDIPKALLRLLLRAGCDVAVLGEREWCCGLPLVAAGMKGDLERLKEYNLQELRKSGASSVVFNCPSCYYAWHKYYRPQGVKLYHSTQFIKGLISQGRLKLKGLKARATYHDPCDLGRGMGVYDEPRDVITAIPGLELVELPESREYGFCCGGGGDAEMLDASLVRGINSLLVSKTMETGAEMQIEACPQCKRTTMEGMNLNGFSIVVKDIAELVLEQAIFG